VKTLPKTFKKDLIEKAQQVEFLYSKGENVIYKDNHRLQHGTIEWYRVMINQKNRKPKIEYLFITFHHEFLWIAEDEIVPYNSDLMKKYYDLHQEYYKAQNQALVLRTEIQNFFYQEHLLTKALRDSFAFVKPEIKQYLYETYTELRPRGKYKVGDWTKTKIYSDFTGRKNGKYFYIFLVGNLPNDHIIDLFECIKNIEDISIEIILIESDRVFTNIPNEYINNRFIAGGNE
jgi:hypothetical protein